MDNNKKRIFKFLLFYFSISIALLLVFFFLFKKIFWFSLIIWIFSTFGVISISFFTIVNLRIKELEDNKDDSNEDEHKN
ncbi:hypothetical protein [Petrotoga sp. 9PWA.NaAc.5.4]|uniref:hypothetical protein n=1 Tax=Petrotoga sp. 9PWA.NaAc.5.4 TaxID=1434328 RepID=UPI000CBDB942|nr:hypothetical protein [Petrotoga sp. 9PWA.NaAc.5.4]PNR94664.1 hypothetical protein X924_06090 [Petrotoga sp. 9PWA.NaAc.5.4]